MAIAIFTQASGFTLYHGIITWNFNITVLTSQWTYAIAIIILSVHPSVCHTGDPRLNGLTHRNLLCTPHNTVIFPVFEAKYCGPEIRDSPRTRELIEGTPVKSDNLHQYAATTRKRCEIGHKLVLFTNKVTHGLSIGTKISDLQWLSLVKVKVFIKSI